MCSLQLIYIRYTKQLRFVFMRKPYIREEQRHSYIFESIGLHNLHNVLCLGSLIFFFTLFPV